MIGRAAQGRPWIFREIRAALLGEAAAAAPSIAEVRDIMLEHLDALYAFYGEETGVRVARKHLGWYCERHPATDGLRRELMSASTAAVQLELAGALFAVLAGDKARAA
jgi:tRNA-dihydrouridine synthase B